MFVAQEREADSRIAALHDRLRALPDGATADREATNRVVLALDARASSVRAHLQQLRQILTDEHPAVRLSLNELRAIDARRSAIRAVR